MSYNLSKQSISHMGKRVLLLLNQFDRTSYPLNLLDSILAGFITIHNEVENRMGKSCQMVLLKDTNCQFCPEGNKKQ